jgi:hypothetical protein
MAAALGRCIVAGEYCGEALAHQVSFFRHAFLVDDGVGADLPED